MLGRFRNPNRRPDHASRVPARDQDKQWFQAVKSNDDDTVKSLLESGHKINVRDRAGNSALILACRFGHSSIVDLLLEHTADMELQNNKGQTALHQAARRGHAEIAATLLAHGADFKCENRKGQSPLDTSHIKVETLHTIRQHYHRAPSPRTLHGGPHSIEVDRLLAELRENGIVKLSDFLRQDEVRTLAADFDEFVATVQRKTEQGDGVFNHYDGEEYWRPNEEIFVTNNPFKYSTLLTKLCCHELVCDLATCYFGKPTFIQRGVAMRYLPKEEMDNFQFGWHHDMEEKRFKMMILLSDVGQSGQRMSYVNGTHKIFHPYERFLKNSLDFDYCRQHVQQLEISETTGKAGDIFFFDSNGMHRGNRSLEATRDAIFVEYTSDTSNVWGGDIPSEFLQPNAIGVSPFQRMAEVKHKKWEVKVKRTTTTWGHQLPQPESWIVPGIENPSVSDGPTSRGLPLQRAG